MAAVIYEVSEGGEVLRIELSEVGEGVYDLTFEGETVRVDAAKSGRTIYSIIEDGKQFEAMVEERGAHGFDILVSGRLFHLDAVDERSKVLAQQARSVAEGPQSVEAQMPGKVVKVHVAAGARVAEGQGVMVVEAMKMENEIASPIDGIVKEMSVSEGQTVETGATLFVVVPPPEES
jgi:biotin carboxyl carrier protein